MSSLPLPSRTDGQAFRLCYTKDMEVDPKKVLDEALRLPAEARAALASSLIESLDAEVDPDAEAAWAVEIEKRLREIDAGAVKLVPWAEARKRILGSRNAQG